jgi:hypothetical protein
MTEEKLSFVVEMIETFFGVDFLNSIFHLNQSVEKLDMPQHDASHG